MFQTSVYTLISVLIVSALSLGGIAFFLAGEIFTKRVLLYVVSFSAGALLGDIFLHLLPEMTEDGGLQTSQALLILGGMLASFCIEKFIHWHHCHHFPSADHHHPVGTMALIADGLHNIVDGVLIAGSFLVDVRIGIATTVAVALHEIPQEISDYALLIYSGYTRRAALLLNFLSALTAVLGAALTLVASEFMTGLTGIIVPLAAGNLLYIAGSDLIPELHKHVRLRQGMLQLAGIVAGIVVMYAMLWLE